MTTIPGTLSHSIYHKKVKTMLLHACNGGNSATLVLS